MFESSFSIRPVLLQLIQALLDRLESPSSSRGGQADSPSAFEPIVRQAAARYGVDAGLVRSVIQAESAFNPSAVSQAGAMGLMQLMPGTAARLGVTDAFDPAQNVDAGTRLLRDLLDRYHGNTAYALAAYNAGPGAVDKYGGIPPYPETQRYVPRVLSLAQSQSGPGAAPSGEALWEWSG